MTTKSELNAQKRDLKEQPKIQYRKHVCDPALQPVLAPRNAKQCVHYVANERANRMLSKDDIVGVYLIESETPDYIHLMQLIPQCVIVFFTMPMVKLFEQVVRLPELVLHYDTTFNLGDFYVSVILYKHPAFENGPIIPLAYMLHQSKKSEVHKLFVETVKKKLQRWKNTF